MITNRSRSKAQAPSAPAASSLSSGIAEQPGQKNQETKGRPQPNIRDHDGDEGIRIGAQRRSGLKNPQRIQDLVEGADLEHVPKSMTDDHRRGEHREHPEYGEGGFDHTLLLAPDQIGHDESDQDRADNGDHGVNHRRRKSA